MRKTSSHAGYTSIELLVAAVFLIAVLTPVVNSLFKSVKASANAMANTLAVAKGRELMDRIRSHAWDESGRAPVSSGSRSAIGTDAGESDPTLFNDVDDFDGYSDQAGEYKRDVRVGYVNMTGAYPSYIVTPVAGPTDYKRIVIEVTGPSGQTARVTDIAANTVE